MSTLDKLLANVAQVHHEHFWRLKRVHDLQLGHQLIDLTLWDVDGFQELDHEVRDEVNDRLRLFISLLTSLLDFFVLVFHVELVRVVTVGDRRADLLQLPGHTSRVATFLRQVADL